MFSQLCLGTMNIGPFTTENVGYAIMDKALELGINFIDTANVYGRKLGEAVTESISTARPLGKRSGRRWSCWSSRVKYG